MGICDDLAELLKGDIASTPQGDQVPAAEKIRKRFSQPAAKVKAVPPSEEASRELERKQAAKRSRSPRLSTPRGVRRAAATPRRPCVVPKSRAASACPNRGREECIFIPLSGPDRSGPHTGQTQGRVARP